VSLLGIIVVVLFVAGVVISSAVGFARSFGRRGRHDVPNEESLGVVLLGEKDVAHPASSLSDDVSHSGTT
jgi:hypothetical protein